MASFSAAVCAHVDRSEQANALSAALTAPIAWDDGSLGSNPNHDRAWQLAYETALQAGTDWCLVLEDDAQPIPELTQALPLLLQDLPDNGICSLYTGTGRPPHYQPRIAQAHSLAALGRATYLRHTYLLWGVAVAIRTAHIPDMLAFVTQFPELPYDYRIGEWLVARGMHCYYTTPSLVDHEDSTTLITHYDGQPRTEPRKAWSTGTPPMSGLHVDI